MPIIKQTELGQLVQNYSPANGNLLKSFQTRYSNLNNRATQMAKFKRDVLAAKPGILNIDHLKDWKEFKEFSKLSQPEQYRAWRMARKDAETDWQEALASKDILPQNLRDLNLSAKESKERKINLADRQKKMNKEDTITIDGNAMINKLSCLESDNKWEVLTGLLLATGRRISELLKFGDFKHEGADELSMEGQLKAGANEKERFQFPVLAPADYILKRLDFVRQAVPSNNLTAAELMSSYAKTIGTYTDKLMGVNPHKLRAIYANMAAEAFAPKKQNKVSYIADILGHAGNNNAVFYTRVKVENYDGQIYHPSIAAKDEKLPGPQLLWSPTNASDVKKVTAIKSLVKAGKALTIAAIRAAGGGDAKAISAFLGKNTKFVEWYNKHL